MPKKEDYVPTNDGTKLKIKIVHVFNTAVCNIVLKKGEGGVEKKKRLKNGRFSAMLSTKKGRRKCSFLLFTNGC